MDRIIRNSIKMGLYAVLSFSLLTLANYLLLSSEKHGKISQTINRLDLVNNLVLKARFTDISNLFPAKLRGKETKYIIVHHSGTFSDYNPFAINDYHVSKNWKSIAYHFFINKKGEIHKLHDLESSTANAKGYNYNSVSVCVSGNFSAEEINKKQLIQLIKILRFLKEKYPQAEIVGHKDVNKTACPGNLPVKQIAEIVSNIHFINLLQL